MKPLEYNPALADMTYEEWLKYKKDLEKKVTRCSEQIEDEEPYSIVFALNRHCFSKMFSVIPLYWLSEQMKQERPLSAGMYGYGVIMLDRANYLRLSKKERINLIFHEMTHAYCDLKGIKDTDEEGYHMRAFAEAVEAHEGKCRLSEEGWTEASLTEEAMSRVLKELKRKSISGF